MAKYDVVWSAVLPATTTSVSVGQCLVHNTTTGYYEIATSANRALYGKTAGVAASVGDATNRTVELISTGIILASITGLGTGTASWVRVSTTGTLERCTPGVGDDLVGWCETDGTLHANFGFLTYAITTSAGFTAGGDLTGTVSSQTVVKANGASVPASGALTTGNVLQVNGAASLTYGAVNLAGGANYVTGLLPLANQAAPTGTGFATVTSGAWDAASAAYPIAFAKGGTGATTLAAGAIKSTGTVLASAGLGTGLQVLRTNAGATDVEWATVTSSPGGSTTQVQFNDAGSFAGDADCTWDKTNNVLLVTSAYAVGSNTATTGNIRMPNAGWATWRNAANSGDVNVVRLNASNVTEVNSTSGVIMTLAGTTYFAVGPSYNTSYIPIEVAASQYVIFDTTPATSGKLRMPNNTEMITFRNAANSGNLTVLDCDAFDQLFIGGSSAYGQQSAAIRFYSSGHVYIGIASSNYLDISAGGYVGVQMPLIGSNAAYGDNGKIDVAMGDANHTLSSSEYIMRNIRATGALTTQRNLTFPAPAADNPNGYWKYVNNACLTYPVVIGTGTGNTISLGAGFAATIWFDTGGAHQMTSNIAGW